MGYTHYYQDIKFSENGWIEMKKAFNSIRRKFPKGMIKVDKRDNAIIFNGVKDDAYETFILTQLNTGFNFCKTARKPYDLAVCVTLILASLYSEDIPKSEIDSDGFKDNGGSEPEWKVAWEFVKTHHPKATKDLDKTFKNFTGNGIHFRE